MAYRQAFTDASRGFASFGQNAAARTSAYYEVPIYERLRLEQERMQAERANAQDRQEFSGLGARRYQPSIRSRAVNTTRDAYTSARSRLNALRSRVRQEKSASLGRALAIGIPAAALVGAGAYFLGKKKKKPLTPKQKTRLRLAKLDSSMIRGAARTGQGTTIEFTSGRRYRFKNVPDHVYQGLLNASSHGQYFNQHIRGKYDYEIV